MFVDASALVAIVTREDDADRLADRLDTDEAPITSSIAVFEATLAVCRKRQSSVAEAEADVRALLEVADVRLVPVTDADAVAALEAFSRYGKGRGHPAQLNMADCFAYAIASTRGTGLLYKGHDFSHTDLARNLRS